MLTPQEPSLVWLRPRSPSPSLLSETSEWDLGMAQDSEWDLCSQPESDSDLPSLISQEDDDSEDENYNTQHKPDTLDEPYEDLPVKFGLKYKKVKDKVRPVCRLIPEYQKTQRHIPEDPLANLPSLPFHPPEFIPSSKITAERMTSLGIEDHDELCPEERRLLQHVLLINQRSIAFDEDERGTFRQDYFSDYIIPTIDHEPWIEKNIPLHQGNRDELINLLKEKIKAGVYERAQTPYRSKWFYVKKKDGGLRIVHDLQKLNSVTIRDSTVPPILEEFVEAYAGRSVYSVLDMFWGFHARILDVNSRDLTAFQTPIGSFRLTSLPMGYANSPAEFQACMLFLLQEEMPKVAGVFVDDIPIKGPSSRYLGPDGEPETLAENPGIRRYIWEHLNDLHRILHRIGQAGGTVSGKKMQLCRTEVQIVGHKCSSEGRKPVGDRAEKIQTWPTPINLSEVRGFLGLCGTVRIWIKDFSEIARPLVDLTRKETPFHWGPDQEDAFDHLKTLVSSAPALRPIDYHCGRPVILSVDTSIHGIGFILSQEDEYGRRAAARYGSLPIHPQELKYGQSKLEMYGLMRALEAFKPYVSGIENLVVEVDASSIEGMLRRPQVSPSDTINRWISKVNEYDFYLQHVPASRHKGPDALSRRRFTSEDEVVKSEDPDPQSDPATLASQTHYSSPLLLPPLYPPLEDNSFSGSETRTVIAATATHTFTDHDINNILRYLVTDKMPDLSTAREQRRFQKKAASFYLNQAHMYRHHPGYPPQVVIFPKKRRQEILEEMHEESGHHGVWAVEQQTSLRYFWPGMKDQIKNHVRSCHTCQLRSTKKMHIPITISHPPSLFSKVYLDVMKMPLAKGKQWLVACRDDLSGVTECKAIARDRAKVIARFFLKRIILRYGIVQEVITDNGPSFSKEFTELLKQYGIRHIKISPYNSQANGVVERGHFNIREALVKLCDGKLSQWPLMVPAAVFADRITIRRATGFSPYFLLHGVHPLMPGDLSDATFLVTDYKPGMTTAELIEARTRQLLRLPEDVARARQILKRSRFRAKERFDDKFARRIMLEAYAPDALVLIRNNLIQNSMSIERKTANRYMGPYRVVRQTQGGSYILAEMDGSLLRHHVAAFRLIPYIQREDLDTWATEAGLETADGSSQEASDNGDQDSPDDSNQDSSGTSESSTSVPL